MASCAPYQARARAGGAEEGRVARRRVRRAARCCAGGGEADGGASPKRPQKKPLALPPAAPTGLVPLHRAERSGPPATLRRDQAAALVFRAATGGSTAAASDADEVCKQRNSAATHRLGARARCGAARARAARKPHRAWRRTSVRAWIALGLRRCLDAGQALPLFSRDEEFWSDFCAAWRCVAPFQDW